MFVVIKYGFWGVVWKMILKKRVSDGVRISGIM